jgi:hypothetical protein
MPDKAWVIVAIVVFGIVLRLLLGLLVKDRKKLSQPVRGTLNVVAASHPRNADYATLTLQGVISGSGITPTRCRG